MHFDFSSSTFTLSCFVRYCRSESRDHTLRADEKEIQSLQRNQETSQPPDVRTLSNSCLFNIDLWGLLICLLREKPNPELHLISSFIPACVTFSLKVAACNILVERDFKWQCFDLSRVCHTPLQMRCTKQVKVFQTYTWKILYQIELSAVFSRFQLN